MQLSHNIIDLVNYTQCKSTKNELMTISSKYPKYLKLNAKANFVNL